MYAPHNNPLTITPKLIEGTLHHYAGDRIAFEHTGGNNKGRLRLHQNILIWVGGLGDKLTSVDYSIVLALSLPSNWSLISLGLSSEGLGWGTSSLKNDAQEIAEFINYWRLNISDKNKIGFMGHSTGCQDAMEYVTGSGHHSRPTLDGVILQAPVSDREAFGKTGLDIPTIIKISQEMVAQGDSEKILPVSLTESVFGPTAISAYRILSLLSPNKDGDDDYFSSDLPIERLKASFGSFPPSTPMLILCSGSDEWVPRNVDIERVIDSWKQMIKSGGGVVDEKDSGLIKNATHNLKDCDMGVVYELCERVVRFMKRVESGDWK